MRRAACRHHTSWRGTSPPNAGTIRVRSSSGVVRPRTAVPAKLQPGFGTACRDCMLIFMDMLFDGPANADRTFVFAHGAGGAMDTPFLNVIAKGLGERGIRVARFEFPYMAARREGRRKGAPDREPVLLDSWREAISQLGGGPSLAIGGKSLGGRMASLIADEQRVRALVCFGYPFHPPGRPDRLRTKHLSELTTPALIIQRARD